MRINMSQQLGGQPIIILREGTTRNRGQEAQNNNFAAAKAVAVCSTLNTWSKRHGQDAHRRYGRHHHHE